MNVSCPQCSTVYRVDPAKVPEGGVRARCSTCGGVIPIGMQPAQASMQTPADAMSSAFGERKSQPGPFMPGPERTATPPRPVQRTPQVSPRVSPPATPRVTPPASQPIQTPQSPGRSLGASLPPLRPTPRATPAVPTPPAQPRVATPVSPPPEPVSVPAETPPSPTAATPAAVSSPSGPSSSSAPGARRPINPFLARDPSLRAKRLARALVSDMVAYYPAKHAEGLEKGTLKELFRDEIKKSYEEYVAQVGADFARSTTHFQESLNEVLGAGRKIF
jgi:predicted Zn finger-like uncharacterized protein